jgi:type IV pilus assembly protein PilM
MSFLNKKIVNFDEKIFGLDLSDISVKVFQIEKEGERHKIRSFYTQDIPKGSLEDGVIIDKDKIIYAIKEAVKKAGPKKINTRKVICSLPESKAFLRVISIPKMEESEAKEAIKWEVEASIPLSVDQVYFDWQFIEEDKEKKDLSRQNVLTVAVSKEVVDGFMGIFQEAGLDVYGLELESIAIVRSLIKKESENKEAFLVVDLGAQITSFIITEGNVPYFTSSIHFSSDGITDAISKSLGVANKEAEEIKIERGLENCAEDSSVLSAIEPLLENLTAEINKTIDFYVNTSKNNLEIKRVILSGGGSNMKGLVPYLVKKINKDVEEGDPWVNLDLGEELPSINKKKSAGFATVVGLALRGIEYEN